MKDEKYLESHYRTLGTSIVVDLQNGYSVLATAKYSKNEFCHLVSLTLYQTENFHILESFYHPFMCKRLERNIRIHAERTKLRDTLCKEVLARFYNGSFDEAIVMMDQIDFHVRKGGDATCF